MNTILSYLPFYSYFARGTHPADQTVEIFTSYDKLKDFFLHAEDLNTLHRLAQPPPSPLNASHQWQWLGALTPYVSYYSKIFFQRLHPYIQSLSPTFAASCSVRLERMRQQVNMTPHLQFFKHKLLTSSMNAHQLRNAPLYTQTAIPLRTRYFNHQNKMQNYSQFQTVDFLSKDGLCFGMCIWFFYLYFKTTSLFQDPLTHVLAVGKIFEDGAPLHAAVAQAINKDLALHILKLKIDFKTNSPSNFLETNTLRNDPNSSKEFLQNILPGTYHLTCFEEHGINWIKIDDTLGFLFDPNAGVVHLISGDNYPELLLKIFQNLANQLDPWSCYGVQVSPVSLMQDEELQQSTYTIQIEK